MLIPIKLFNRHFITDIKKPQKRVLMWFFYLPLALLAAVPIMMANPK